MFTYLLTYRPDTGRFGVQELSESRGGRSNIHYVLRGRKATLNFDFKQCLQSSGAA